MKRMRLTVIAVIALFARLSVASDTKLDPRVEIARDLELASRAVENGNPELAETFFRKLLVLDVPDAQIRTALLKMGEAYRDQRAFSKVIAIYEKFLDLFSKDAAAPEIAFRLGLIYREMGATEMAIKRFYTVLNASLSGAGPDLAAQKELTQRAQFEIAETSYSKGDYAQARRYFNQLERLELTAVERERLLYQRTSCAVLEDDHAAAVELARQSLTEFGNGPHAAECRYLLATALHRLGRRDEAVAEVLNLLRAEKKRDGHDAEMWEYWQRKAGNQIANELYAAGAFAKALTIYQTMAKTSDAPDWQWPVVYQIGLCFERMRLPLRAKEAYDFILKEAGGKDQAALPESLRELGQMARWREENLLWMRDTDQQLADLIPANHAAPAN